MLFVSVDSAERLWFTVSKINVVFLHVVSVKIKGVQLTWTNLDFIFSGTNLFLSVRLIMLIQVFDDKTDHFNHILGVCVH